MNCDSINFPPLIILISLRTHLFLRGENPLRFIKVVVDLLKKVVAACCTSKQQLLCHLQLLCAMAVFLVV